MLFVGWMLLLMFLSRKAGWLASRMVLYRQIGAILVISCAVWGLAVAWVIHASIDAAQPSGWIRWIFGYLLGAYIAIPNYGLLIESTIPEQERAKHRIISQVPLVVYGVVSAGLAYLAPTRSATPPISEVAAVQQSGPNSVAPRSVRNFLFALDAMRRADQRPPGIQADSNVHRVAALFREALDSCAVVDSVALDSVYAGLGTHFVGDLERHMAAVVRIEQTHSSDAASEAMTSVVAWQRWWQQNERAALAVIAGKYRR